MSSFIPSNKENMYANCGDDDESMAETNSLNRSTLEDNEKNEGIYSKPYKRNIPSHKQKRFRKIVKKMVFGVVALMAIVAFCLAVHSEYVIALFLNKMTSWGLGYMKLLCRQFLITYFTCLSAFMNIKGSSA